MKKQYIDIILKDFKKMFPIPDEGIIMEYKATPYYVYHEERVIPREVKEETHKEHNFDKFIEVDGERLDVTHSIRFESNCQHHVEARSYVTTRVKFQDINGSILWEKQLCDKCFIEFYANVKRFGGKLIF